MGICHIPQKSLAPNDGYNRQLIAFCIPRLPLFSADRFRTMLDTPDRPGGRRIRVSQEENYMMTGRTKRSAVGLPVIWQDERVQNLMAVRASVAKQGFVSGLHL